MFVRYKGKVSSPRYLPGGGPQGTLLGLLLFIVLINDVGFSEQVNNAGELATKMRTMELVNKIHLKFIDDLTIAESVNLRQLKTLPPISGTLPDTYPLTQTILRWQMD